MCIQQVGYQYSNQHLYVGSGHQHVPTPVSLNVTASAICDHPEVLDVKASLVQQMQDLSLHLQISGQIMVSRASKYCLPPRD